MTSLSRLVILTESIIVERFDPLSACSTICEKRDPVIFGGSTLSPFATSLMVLRKSVTVASFSINPATPSWTNSKTSSWVGNKVHHNYPRSSEIFFRIIFTRLRLFLLRRPMSSSNMSGLCFCSKPEIFSPSPADARHCISFCFESITLIPSLRRRLSSMSKSFSFFITTNK